MSTSLALGGQSEGRKTRRQIMITLSTPRVSRRVAASQQAWQSSCSNTASIQYRRSRFTDSQQEACTEQVLPRTAHNSKRWDFRNNHRKAYRKNYFQCGLYSMPSDMTHPFRQDTKARMSYISSSSISVFKRLFLQRQNSQIPIALYTDLSRYSFSAVSRESLELHSCALLGLSINPILISKTVTVKT